MLNKNKWGFTLVELLITVAVLGILSAAAYVGAGEVRKTIRDNKRRADLNEVARALELFKADYGQYPSGVYYSADYSEGPGHGDERPFVEFLVNGGPIYFYYPGGVESKDTLGGYLKEDKRDPINHVESLWEGFMYVYWGAQWGNLALNYLTWLDTWAESADLFPMYCPIPNDGDDYCGDDTWTLEQNWDACCNSGGCYDAYCNFADPDVTIISTYSQNGWSAMCYGDDTTRSMAVLMAKLEKPSKSEERLDNILAFCPTADPSHPYHDSFLTLKKIFPRTKDCYTGNPVDNDPNGGVICEDEELPYSSYGWNGYLLGDYNYFVPLTGEFNLR